MAPGSWTSGSPKSSSAAEGRRRWPVTTCIFSLLDREQTIEKELVDQLRGNWNSVLAWLREVLAWSRPAGAVS